MKKLIILILFQIFFLTRTLANPVCSFSEFITKPSLNEDKLSFYWAQILMGSDLAAKELAKIDTRKVNFGIYDETFNTHALSTIHKDVFIDSLEPFDEEIDDAHGNHVANLISGVNRVSLSKNGNLVFAGAVGPYASNSSRFGTELLFPEVINISHDILPFSSPEDFIQHPELQSFLDNNIYVCASNNYYPSTSNLPIGDCDLKIGSIDHTGLISFYSMEGSGVSFVAPSGLNLGSFDGLNYKIFGGTSGATPLSAASAIDILSIFNKQEISGAQVINILNMSTLALPQLQNGQNGSGVLNHLKAIYLAKALKQELGLDLLSIASDYFNKAKNESCDSKKLDLYRYSFLLGNGNIQRESATQIANIFISLGLSETAVFYQNFANDFAEYKNMSLESLFEETRPSVIRAAFDLESLTIDDALENFSKFTPTGRVFILNEIVHNTQYQQIIKTKTRDSDIFDQFNMPVGEWAEYLIRRFKI